MRPYLFCLLVAIGLSAQSSDLKTSSPILYSENGQTYAVLNVEWDNAWNNSTNNDGAWVFFKFLRGSNGYTHVKLLPNGHKIVSVHSGGSFTSRATQDGMGLFIQPSSSYRGKVSLTLKVMLDKTSFERVNTRSAYFEAYGIEMVRIPEGGFYIGTADTTGLKFGALYKSKGSGEFDGLYQVKKETDVIEIGEEKGQLFYQAPEGYEGDQTGVLPAEFPKGVRSFWIMKYEPTQGQYVDFLNSLSENASQHRANFGGKDYYERGSIRIRDGEYSTKTPNAPCNHMSWDDAMAYADWAGLRPMTELEFIKASRGISRPTVYDYPWGTDEKSQLQRMVSEKGDLVMLNGWDESKLTNESKPVFGASAYWVMDLAGSMWERVVSVGSEKGRSFTGTHGDGQLTGYGFATNEDWPSGIDGDGFGFRGGGFYGYGRDYHDFNPFSHVSDRTYGGWAGGNRVAAYGARFVRTAD